MRWVRVAESTLAPFLNPPANCRGRCPVCSSWAKLEATEVMKAQEAAAARAVTGMGEAPHGMAPRSIAMVTAMVEAEAAKVGTAAAAAAAAMLARVDAVGGLQWSGRWREATRGTRSVSRWVGAGGVAWV